MGSAGMGAAESVRAGGGSEEVDPVAEAEIFLAYGRDAQAEELLTEAIAASPHRYEIHLKLLQIYAKRKDTKAFEKVARDMQQGTGGAGPLWEQAVVLGYQTDPENPRYADGKSFAGEAAAVPAASAAENVDFNVGFEDSTATTTDIDLGDDSIENTQIIDPTSEGSHQDTTVLQPEQVPTMDFNVDLPPVEPEAGSAPTGKAAGSALDFDIDLNALNMPSGDSAARPEPTLATGGGLDFDMSGLSLEMPGENKVEPAAAAPEIDLSGINLNLGTETTPQRSPTGKDDRWYDVQTKFDLAKAYQEMGDKDGAREILKEVLQEGDAEQKAAAQTVLTTLGA